MPSANNTDLEGLLQVDATSTRAVRASTWKKVALVVTGAVGLAAGCAAAGWHAHKAYVGTSSVKDATQLQSVSDWQDYTGYTEQLTKQWAKYEQSQTSSDKGSSSSQSSTPQFSISDFTNSLQKSISAVQSTGADVSNSMAKFSGAKGLDPKTTDCRIENQAYSPLDNIPGEPASSELLDTLCMLRCANTTGCAFYTFYPGVMLGNCHIMNEFVHSLQVMSVGDIPGPVSGRVCDAKELAKKAAQEVIKSITANLTEAYEMCEEKGVSYAPWFSSRMVSNVSSCRTMCESNEPKCFQWTYRAIGRICEISTNSTYLYSSKGVHGVVSAKRSCDKDAEEKAARKQEAEERKKNRPRLFGRHNR